MSKKRLHSRLKKLFSNLADEEPTPSLQSLCDGEQALSGSEGTDDPEKEANTQMKALQKTPGEHNAVHRSLAVPPSRGDLQTRSVLSEAKIRSKSKPVAQQKKQGQVIVQAEAPSQQHGYALEQGSFQSASQVWTGTGLLSLARNEPLTSGAQQDSPAAMAVPMRMQGIGDLLLEIVDDSGDREWSEDDRFLLTEVAAQLELALDNAHLYMSVQQELAERIRAEQAILRRNKDLAALNQVGQQLSRLATPAEIFELLTRMIGEVLDNQNLFICTTTPNRMSLVFPVYQVNGQAVDIPGRAFANGIPEYVINNRSVLLITGNTPARLLEKGIDLPDRVPAALLAIPMVAGERTRGAIVLQNYTDENAFDAIHAELLSTAAAQATTALENAELFQQMQSALQAIENRERYQANVARSAAILTEFGTKSLPEVLKALGQATLCSRVYYAQLREDERGIYWSASADWVDPELAYLFDKTRILHLPVGLYHHWAESLRNQGWTVTQASDEQTSENEFLNHQHIRSTLLLAVPGQGPYPNFIAFDQVGLPKIWQSEEIDALRVATDAIANTFTRERLLEQVQLTLEETESLYKASNRLALANDMQEMVAAILSGVRITDINRAVLLLFEYDNYEKISMITVGANWYSGRGTPPPPVSTEYIRAKYERFFQTSKPIFYDDILEAQIDKEMQETMLHQNIRAVGILPLWSGKRQIGILLLQSETRHHFSEREIRTYPPLVDQMAIAVENQHLFEQTQKALAETELLYKAANAISQATDPQEMLATVVDSLLPAGADRVSLILIESDANGELTSLDYVGSQDVDGEYQQLDLTMPVSSLPLVKSLADEPLIFSNIRAQAQDTATLRTFEELRVAACCLVPLRTSGKLIGLLNISSRVPVEFDRNNIRLLRIIASGIAVALEKQRLLRQAQRRALELQTASEIARDTASTLSLDLLLPRIVEMLRDRFGFYHASIFLLDESGTNAVIRESTGEAGQELKQRGHRLAVGSRSVVGTVTATGEPFILNDVSQSPMYYPNPLLSDTRSEMGVPLKLGETVIGALDLQSRSVNAFNQDDVTVLQILADQVAIAIENARAYELSQQAVTEMKEIDRVKSQFLANMSHELRTPLNSIIGFSRVILKGIDGPINEIQSQDLSAIYNSGQHLLSLINDILDLSKIEAGKMELAFTEINLADMINSAMSTAIGLVKDKPIKLETQIPEKLPPVRADSTRIRQVLINFLSNAAKFTEEGSVEVNVSLTTSPLNRPELMVTVSDTGPGIAPEDQGKLFLPFSQVDDSPTRKTGGTGLGLSICRSLIEMHGGRIGLLSSQPGMGSTFFFTLPLSEEEMFGQDETTRPEEKIILAIDDDPKVISLYERYLKPHGYRIIPLTDPKHALAKVKETRPFAVTLDIMMPEKDGWQIMRELKNNPETRDTPIVICSIIENQEKGFSMGAADYLVKPFLQDDMLNAISRLNRDGQIKEVLVIDDDPDSLRLIRKILEEKRQFHVTTARGGIQGWELIQSRLPDIIILDLFMPDMTGFTILQSLREKPNLRQIPVIVLSGADLTSEQHNQLTEFSQAVVTKGLLREGDLLALLEKTLRAFQPQQTE